MRAHFGFWFGWNGEICRDSPPPVTFVTNGGVTCATIPLPERLYTRYYEGFSNSTLWPLLHDCLSAFRYDAIDYAGYLDVNNLFASKLAPLVQATDLIWVHDYHLIPLAERLRIHKIRNRIGYFLHAPFPPFETLRALPNFDRFVTQLLEYDAIGFQTEISRQHFLDAIRATCDGSLITRGNTIVTKERAVCTRVLPIGIDSNAVTQEADDTLRSGVVSRLMQSLQGTTLILGVDRLDYSKGVVEKLNAYESLLETFPDLRSKVTLLQVSPFSRVKVEAYGRIRTAIEQAVGRINGRFATADWTPIRYLNRDYPHSTLMGLMRVAKVCVVTALKDGMNLVAKEYLGAQDLEDPGVLVLSNRAGAAHELTDALIINPYDVNSVAHSIYQAISMTHAERCARHCRLRMQLEGRSIQRWHGEFLELLREERGVNSQARSG